MGCLDSMFPPCDLFFLSNFGFISEFRLFLTIVRSKVRTVRWKVAITFIFNSFFGGKKQNRIVRCKFWHLFWWWVYFCFEYWKLIWVFQQLICNSGSPAHDRPTDLLSYLLWLRNKNSFPRFIDKTCHMCVYIVDVEYFSIMFHIQQI